MSPDLTLTPGEKLSPAWQKTVRIIERQLEINRRDLETGKNFDETNIIRGKIKAYRFLLSLQEDRPMTLE